MLEFPNYDSGHGDANLLRYSLCFSETIIGGRGMEWVDLNDLARWLSILNSMLSQGRLAMPWLSQRVFEGSQAYLMQITTASARLPVTGTPASNPSYSPKLYFMADLCPVAT